jgi:cytidylate kinase
MTNTSFLHRQTQALQKLMDYGVYRDTRENDPERTATDRFSIALSREAGTPAVEVAWEVASKLNWTVYDRELPLALARELKSPLEIVEEIDERRQSWLLECIGGFVSAPELSESRYFHHMTALIRSLGEQGRCVIVGRGAAYVLPPQSTLRVRLVGDREDRIAAFGRRRHLDHPTAAREVEEVNREHSRFIREHFHIDPAKARHYDLVLNTSQWSAADCADFILKALHHKATGHLKG